MAKISPIPIKNSMPSMVSDKRNIFAPKKEILEKLFSLVALNFKIEDSPPFCSYRKEKLMVKLVVCKHFYQRNVCLPYLASFVFSFKSSFTVHIKEVSCW